MVVVLKISVLINSMRTETNIRIILAITKKEGAASQNGDSRSPK
jgi:hypothetical protein